MSTEKLPGVGVVIGRFQVPDLHEGHLAILDKANRHHRMLVFLGCHRIPMTRSNPLDYQTREAMILEKYPNASVVAINDEPTDEAWSRNLNRLIRTYCPLGQVTLYCGRDGFNRNYAKGFKVHEIEQVSPANGTDIRTTVGQTVRKNQNFRAGVIFGAFNMYPRLNPTVDIALLRGHKKERMVLLGMKAERPGLWRFPGGFVDKGDGCAENAAKRELHEETGIVVDKVEYVASSIIDDWRSTDDNNIMTFFYKAEYQSGAPQASDDLDAVKWVYLSDLADINMVKTHHVLRDLLLKNESK